MMATLFSAGGESTASLIGSAAYIFATRPGYSAAGAGKPGLLVTFLEEVLRYEPPFRGHYRHVLNDTVAGGRRPRRGIAPAAAVGCGQSGPVAFRQRQETFRLDRPGGKAHISFGKGAHFCVGAALARLEARIVIGQLLERTSHIEAADTGRWLPSLLVRRLEHLELTVA